MADNVGITAGSGTTIAADDVGGIKYQIVKLDVGADGVSAGVSNSNPVPISDAGASITIDGTVAATQSGAWSVKVQDGAGNLLTSKAPGSERALSVAIVDGSGNQVTSFGGAGGTSMTDDAAFTVGSGSVTPAGGIYKSTRDSVDDGDAGALAMTAKRGLYTSLETPLGDSAMDDTLDAIKVSIVGDSVGSTVDTDDGTVAAAQANIALVIDLPYEYDATNFIRVRGPHTVAHDAADAGNPSKLGAKAETALSGITLVADGDRTDLYAGIDGVLITRPYANLEDVVSGNASNTDGTSTSVIASSGAGVRTYITTAIITNMHASTDAYVELKDGTTVMATLPAPHASGAVVNFPVPLKGTAATAWNFDPSAAVTTLYCTLVGFKSKV